MYKLLIFSLLLVLPWQRMLAQMDRAGGGLSFSSGVDFNTIETGNPGIFGKAWFKLSEKVYLSPSVTAYNRYSRSTVIHSFTNYMFQGDLDVHYQVFREGPLRVYLLAGGNATGIISRYEVYIGDSQYSNQQAIKPGLNMGGGVEMYVNQYLDAVLSGKYIAGRFDQVVIQLSVVRVFYSRRRVGW